MSDRQNPFDDLVAWDNDPSPASEPAAYLPPPPSKLNRDRTWERAQRSDGYCQISYRKIPVEIRDAIRKIAQEHYLRVDDVGRLFLEYALNAYEAGEIPINPILDRGKLTLFPQK